MDLHRQQAAPLRQLQQPPQYHQYYDEIQLIKFQLNKLQAYKSSFQAWKCVSFGYALLAIVLLFSKWQEVTTDLKLLTSIDQLIWSNSSLNHDHLLLVATNRTNLAPSQQQQGNWSNSASILSQTLARSWPPLPLETLLLNAATTSVTTTNGSNQSLDSFDDAPASTTSSAQDNNNNNSGGGGGESGGDSSEMGSSSAASSMLMSQHMQLVAGRELSGSQLLRQEVESFLAEFRSAKLTLSLSSLLVIVYIISWILMALAVNDTRISFNVKNNSFVADILGSSGLHDSPVRLSADQLTAFTALRLIAMRSCSAYIDVYVSVIVALLTTLRLYAIVRAIAYYRFLRHFNDSARDLHHQQQLATVTSYATVNSNNNNSHKGLGAVAFDRAERQFSFNSGTGSHLNHLQEPTTGAKIVWQHSRPANLTGYHQQQQQHVSMDNNTANAGADMILTSPSGQVTVYSPGQYQQQAPTQAQNMWRQSSTLSAGEPEAFNYTNEHQYQNSSSKLQVDPNLSSYSVPVVSPKLVVGQPQYQQAAHTSGREHNQAERQEPTLVRHSSTTTTNQRLPPLLQLSTTTTTPPPQPTATDRRYVSSARHTHSMATAKPVPQIARRTHLSQASPMTVDDLSAPNLLLVNGRTHRLVSGPSSYAHRSTTGRLRGSKQLAQLIRRRDELGDSSASGAGFDSEPVEFDRNRRAQRRHDRGHQDQYESGGELNQLDANNNNNLSLGGHKGAARKQAASFTLLSASQLERLSRKLLARSAANTSGAGDGQSGRDSSTANRAASLGKYRVIARYRPVRGAHEEEPQVVSGSGARTQSIERSSSQLTSARHERVEVDSRERLVGHAGASNRLAPNPEEEANSSSDATPTGSASSASSESSSGSDDDQLIGVDSIEGLVRPSDHQVANKSVATASQRGKPAHGKRSGLAGSHEQSRSGLRHTEEFNLSPMATTKGGRELLLEKCKYHTGRCQSIMCIN